MGAAFCPGLLFARLGVHVPGELPPSGVGEERKWGATDRDRYGRRRELGLLQQHLPSLLLDRLQVVFLRGRKRKRMLCGAIFQVTGVRLEIRRRAARVRFQDTADGKGSKGQKVRPYAPGGQRHIYCVALLEQGKEEREMERGALHHVGCVSRRHRVKKKM